MAASTTVRMEEAKKTERFFQTFELYYPRFNDMERFKEYYNKPHRSLKYKTPAQAYLN
jgi:transposase InsO family protein